MQHILVCLDFSELSKQVIPFAVTLARGFGAKITVLHVLEKSHSKCTLTLPLEWYIFQENYDYRQNRL